MAALLPRSSHTSPYVSRDCERKRRFRSDSKGLGMYADVSVGPTRSTVTRGMA